MARFRSCCFTLNNYTEADLTHLSQLTDKDGITYIVFQRERGANGTPHVQGYINSANSRSLASWRTLISGRAHIERARGTAQENQAYCSKDEGREPGTTVHTWGRIPEQGKRNDLDAVGALIKGGATEREVFESDPSSYIKFSAGIKRALGLIQGKRSWKTRVFWFYGPTGTGKSREAYDRFPEAYTKPGATKWWDGYDGQSDVIVDDYRRDFCTFAELLRLLDRYPLTVEYKGGYTAFLARNIVITTPYCPRRTWEGRCDEDIAQLERRIEEVKLFDVVHVEE